MELRLVVRGAVIGMAIAAPVGPIAVLLIRRTIAQGRAVGYASGLGAATADLTYGLLVALGVSVVTDALVSAERGLRVVGGLGLVAVGIRTLRSRTPAPAEAREPTRRTVVAAYASTLGLTLANPATILSFLAVFAGVGVVSAAGSTGDALSLAAGVAVGSAAWQLSLCTAAALLRARLTTRAMSRVNVVSGTVITAFGIVAIGSAVAWAAP